jgi:hypothetical protein
MPQVAPDALSVKLPAHLNAVPAGGFKGTISVYRRVPQLTSAAKEFQFQPVATVQQPASSCPQAGAHVTGYTHVGQPSCITGNASDHPGAYLQCDAGGYYCCEPAQGANTKCGTNRWTYPANCERYCTGVTNCRVTLMSGGCYKAN